MLTGVRVPKVSGYVPDTDPVEGICGKTALLVPFLDLVVLFGGIDQKLYAGGFITDHFLTGRLRRY